MAKNPQFGVPLTPEETSLGLPFYPLYGVTPSNEYIPLQIDEEGKLTVNATFSGSITIGEIGSPDETPFIYGTTLEQTIGGVYQDTDPTLSSGEQGAVRLTEYRAFHSNLRTSGGVELLGQSISAASLPVVIASDQSILPVSFSGNVTVVQPTGSNLHVDVDNFPATQPISGTVTADIGTTGGLALDSTLTDGSQHTLVDNFPAIQPVSGTFWQATQPVSAVSLPLPSGASTSANQSTEITALGTINTTLGSPFQAGGLIGNTSFDATQGTSPWVVSLASTTITGTVAVTQSTSPWVISGSVGRTWTLSHSTDSISDWLSDGSGNPISSTGGSLNVDVTNAPSITNITGTISLPTGAATAANQSSVIANQTNGTQKTQVVDGSDLTAGPFQTISSTNYFPVVLASSGTSGNVVPARTIQIGGTDGTNLRTISTTTTGVVNVSMVPETSGGCLTNVQQALLSSALVKGSAGQMYGYKIYNPNSQAVYVFWYNTASAPTVGSTTNLITQMGIPPLSGANVFDIIGVPHSTGIYVGVSIVATSYTAPSTGVVITTLYD